MIRVRIDDDEMRAVVSDTVMDAGALGVEHLMQALDEAGCTDGIDHDGITKAIMLHQAGQNPDGTVVAKGEPAVEPQDGTIRPAGKLSLPFFRGDSIGQLVPGVQPSVGFTVTGGRIPPKKISSPKELTVEEGSGLTVDEKGMLTATEYGLLQVEGGKVRLKPLLAVSKNALQVEVVVFDRDALGRKITPDRVAALTVPMKIVAKVDKQAVADALVRAEFEKRPIKVVACRGRTPVHGGDAFFESPFTSGLTAGKVLEDGSVDYSERGIVRSVAEGDFLGRITAQNSGVPGMDVFGNSIPARDGKALAFKAGENIDVSEDGLVFHALTSGMLVISDTVIAVSEVCEIAGDISFSTGNVRMDKGSVVIRGSIREGFIVESAGNIVVHGSIEGAQVSAKGDIEVRGGITMMDKGLVKAGGNISAMFAANAVLQARGDIIITNEIVNSRLFCNGRVLAAGSKGKILGGDIRSIMGVEAKEIGSHLGVVSTVNVGCNLKHNEELRTEKKNLQAVLEKIGKVVGDEDPAELLAKTPESKREVMAKLIQIKVRAERKLAEVEHAIEADKDDICRRMNARIRVSKVIHAGTDITLYGKGMPVRKDLKHSVIYFDHEKGGISVGSFS